MVIGLSLTRGQGEEFDDITLERLEKQKIEFKPKIVATSSLIPLVIIAYLVFKK